MNNRNEIIRLGGCVIRDLEEALKELRSANKWSFIDMFGGAFLSTIIKQKKTEKAKLYIEQASYNLRDFSKKLQDEELQYLTDAATEITETNRFLSFSDLFLDNIVSDWMAQDQIIKAIVYSENIMEDVKQILAEAERESI